MKTDIIEFLRSIEDVGGGSPECQGEEFCPEHDDCGLCRYEYMMLKGWLAREAIE